jgi:hypothetical protein
MRLPLFVALATLAACSGETQKDHDDTTAPPPAGSLVRTDGGITAVVTVPPSSVHPDMHLDDDIHPRPVNPAGRHARPGRPIDVTLRSTPPGAEVAVDGTVIGNTPAFWSGMADSREHEFVFTMRGHAIARYRFVPVSSGVIHARLDRIHEERDAGVKPPPEVVPPRPTTSTINPPAAPPTIVHPTPPAPAPDAAAPHPESAQSTAPVGPQP